jgi:hypothetical protein
MFEITNNVRDWLTGRYDVIWITSSMHFQKFGVMPEKRMGHRESPDVVDDEALEVFLFRQSASKVL